MNILIGASYQSPYAGNFIASLLELAETAAAAGDRICFVFPLRKEGERPWVSWLRESGFQVELLDVALPEERLLTQVQDLNRRFGTDLMYLHFGFLQGVVQHRRAALGKLRVLFHDHMGFGLGSPVKKQYRRNLLRSGFYRLRRIGVISVMEDKHRSYGLLGAHHWYVPNGITLRRYAASDLTRDAMRKQCGIPQDARLCLLLAWNPEIKGVDIAVQAIRIARETDPALELGIVTQGSAPDETFLRFLEARTGIDASQTPWLHFLPSTEDIFSYHRMADCFLSASRTEAFPYGVLEAISQSLPIVMSDIPGVSWAREYSRSRTYPTEDPAACAQALLSAPRLGQAASNADLFLNRYSIERWCGRVLEIIHSM